MRLTLTSRFGFFILQNNKIFGMKNIKLKSVLVVLSLLFVLHVQGQEPVEIDSVTMANAIDMANISTESTYNSQ